MAELAATSSAPAKTSRGYWLLYGVVLVGGMLLFFQPTIFSGFAYMQTDSGDTPLNHYFLEHSWRWLAVADYPASFWSPRFFYPTSHTLTYSENMIGVAPLYWGLRLFCSEEIAYQWWILLINAGNYLALLVVLRWFGIHPVLALLGGFLFAFGLPRQDQFAHQQLLPHAFAPFVIWHFAKFMEAPNRRNWFLLLLLIAWQLLASIHLGWFLAFALALLAVIHCLVDRAAWSRVRASARNQRWFLISTTVIWLLGLGLFFRHYYLGNQSFRRHYSECIFFMPDLASWFACPHHSLWGVHLVPGDAGRYGERHLFTGFGFYLLLVLGFIACRRSRHLHAPRLAFARACLWTVVLLVLLTLNYGGGLSPWYLVFHGVPGANSIRVNGRVWFSVILLGLIGGTIALQHLAEKRLTLPSRRVALYAALLVLCAGEQVRLEMDYFRRADFYPRADRLAKELTGADAAFACHDRQVIKEGYEHQITSMWAGLRANVPVINGYSGRLPNDWFFDDGRAGLADALRVLGPNWRGRLLIIRWGEPMQKEYYVVEP